LKERHWWGNLNIKRTVGLELGYRHERTATDAADASVASVAVLSTVCIMGQRISTVL